MRTTRLVLPWSAIVLFSGTIAGCAATASHAGDGLRVDEASLVRTTPDEWRQLRDSAKAQEIADEVGPRVNVTADFDYGESRQVDVTFHMYDDAYVIVGHLDASGRLKIVFPTSPGDDGFVRGDKLYHIPPFFGGFADEYRWRYSEQYRYQNSASRADSYDAGLAYVFVIASWRPMRLDRISDGNKWESYEISDISYMHDPREAVEELGSLIAGDNREAYTIEYAHYYTTNYGTYSLSSFDALNSCYGYGPYSGFGFRRSLFSPYSGFFSALNYGQSSFGCGGTSFFGFGGGYGYPVAYVPITVYPVVPRGPRIPIGTPVVHFPRSGTGTTVAVHRPQVGGATQPPSGSNPSAGTAGLSVYHRPGVIAEDAPGGAIPRPGHASGVEMSPTSTHRPTIQQMIGSRQIDDTPRGVGVREAGRDNSWSSTNRGGVSVSHGAEVGSRWSDNGTHAAAASGRRFGGESQGYSPPQRSAPAPRAEPSHSAPSHSAPAHSEPARSAPAGSSSGSSSSSSKKP